MSETSKFTPSEVALAQIVVDDTISRSFTDPRLARGATVEDTLDSLNGEQGDLMVQEILARYIASESAAESSRTSPSMDMRIWKMAGVIKVNAATFKDALQQELEQFLNSPTEEADARVARVSSNK